MSNYRKVYAKFFSYGDQDYACCEKCQINPMDSVHHIFNKGAFPGPDVDNITNLIGVCRACHDRAHSSNTEEMREEYLQSHLTFMKTWKQSQQ